MRLNWYDLPRPVLDVLRDGAVIPAHPLALNTRGALDERRQRALTRYYIDAGAGGIAVGVHSTQFAIREAGLYQPVLSVAAETVADWGDRPLIRIAGLAGDTAQAKEEAEVARSLGYHVGLLSLRAMNGSAEDELLEHCHAVAEIMPIMGFYLQSAVGGMRLSSRFWQKFCSIENVIAVKMAPFDRYRTLDVVRGIIDARAEDKVALYTGNDDHIVLDLVVPLRLQRDGSPVSPRIVGGLLGHWGCWTRTAVELLARVKTEAGRHAISTDLLSLDAKITDCNGAFFDVANGFRGCIAGIHEVLRRQGLLSTVQLLDPAERLSPGQAEEIDRVYAAYPELNDDEFVKKNLDCWLG